MKALWKCTPEEDVEGEFSQTLIMESEDIELLKRKGYEIAREYESSDS